jgi:hypothetical protein
MTRKFFAFALVTVATGMAGCGGGGGSTSGARQSPAPLPPPAPASTREVGPLRLELNTNRTIYQKGEPVQVNLRVTNVSGQAVTFDSISRTDDKWVVDRNGIEVGNTFMETGDVTPRVITLEPSQSLSYSIAWNQGDIFARPPQTPLFYPAATPGEYQIYATLTWHDPDNPIPWVNNRPGLITAPLTVRIEE